MQFAVTQFGALPHFSIACYDQFIRIPSFILPTEAESMASARPLPASSTALHFRAGGKQSKQDVVRGALHRQQRFPSAYWQARFARVPISIWSQLRSCA